MVWEHCEKPGIYGMRIYCMWKRTMMESMEPVSYTHLDVYKRQMCHSGAGNTEAVLFIT